MRRTSIMSRWVLLAAVGVAFSPGCVISPTRAFDFAYGTAAMGQTKEYMLGAFGTPESVEQTDRGTTVYAFAVPQYHPEKCTVFYEVADEKIIGMTKRGPQCRVSN